MNREMGCKKKSTFEKFMRRYGILVFATLILSLYSVVLLRWQQGRDYIKYYQYYMSEFQAYKDEQRAEAERLAALPPGLEETRQAQSEMLSKVLYGVKDNSTDDLRTYCWCVFNRVDNPNYPDTIEEVISQPKQWMRYDEENPVLETLYDLAYTELVRWQDGSRRPVSNEFVFMNWSPSEIVLRDKFENNQSAHYWRIKN